MRARSNTTLKIVIWGSSLPALLAASFLYYPYVFDGPTICPVPLVTGAPCPGCGLIRSMCLLTHGHVGEAIAFQPLLPFILLYSAFLCAYKIVELSRGTAPTLPTYRIAATAIWITMGFWVVRLGFFFAQGGLATVAHDNLFARLARLFA